MLSSTATRCGHPPGVHPTSSPKPSPPTLLSLPPASFLACPSQHGLGRTGVKSSNDDKLLQAIMSSISYRLEKLSLSDDPALESPNPTVHSPVYAATPAGTDSTPSKNPVRPRLVHTKANLFERLSNGLKAGLYRSIKKRSFLKKPQAPIPPLPSSQCSLVEREYFPIGQRAQAMGGLPVFDTWEANSHTQDTKFQEPLAFVVQGAPAQQIASSTFPQPWSSDTSPSTSSSTVWTLGDEVTDDAMDEDEQRSPSPRSRSPTPMDLEASPPSSDATRAPESPQASVEVSVGRDIRDPVPEPADEVMSDEEQGSNNSEGPHQPEPTDMMMIDSSSTPSVSPTVFNREIDIVDAEDSNPSTSFTSPTTSSAQLARDALASSERIQLATIDTNPRPAPDSVSSADVAASQEQSSPAQPLPTSSFHQVEEVSSAASEPNATNRPVANIQSTDSAPVPTANATLIPTTVNEVVAPPASATESTAGPSTASPASAPRNSTQQLPEQAPNGHASRAHQVLSKLRLSKQAPNSTRPSINDEASEEAEAKAFFDNLFKRAPRRDLPKPQAKPAPPPPTSEPKQTNGSACRSLMDDIMAGFRKSSNPTSPSQQQITATRSTAQTSPTAQPAHQRSIPPVSGQQPDPQPTRLSSVVEARRSVVAQPSGRAPATVSATGKVHSSSPTILSTQQASLPIVAGRQTGPNSPPSSSLARTGRQVAAQLSGRAPSTVSATDKMNGPSGSVSAGAGIPSESHQPSSAGMDGIESGRRPVKGSERVARAIRKTGLTWQLVQQNAQRNQAALDTAQVNAATSTAMRALDRDEEERRSQEWHAAQPPPPPEAIPYITTGEEYEGDENDHEALLDWILGQED